MCRSRSTEDRIAGILPMHAVVRGNISQATTSLTLSSGISYLLNQTMGAGHVDFRPKLNAHPATTSLTHVYSSVWQDEV